MFGFNGMVFLVGISLISVSYGWNVPELDKVLELAERDEVFKMVEAVFENYDYLEDCQETLSLSINVTACEKLAVDLVGHKDFLFTAVEDALELAGEAETLEAEFTTCSTQSILKQIKCYTSVISSARAMVVEAKADEEEFTEDGAAIVQQIDVNFANCFDKGFSSEIFETKMHLCKLKLKLKSN